MAAVGFDLEAERDLAVGAAKDPVAVALELHAACRELLGEASAVCGLLRLREDPLGEQLLAPLERARRACWAADVVCAEVGVGPGVAFALVERGLLGASFEPCRVEVVEGENGLADVVITRLAALAAPRYALIVRDPALGVDVPSHFGEGRMSWPEAVAAWEEALAAPAWRAGLVYSVVPA